MNIQTYLNIIIIIHSVIYNRRILTSFECVYVCVCNNISPWLQSCFILLMLTKHYVTLERKIRRVCVFDESSTRVRRVFDECLEGTTTTTTSSHKWAHDHYITWLTHSLTGSMAGNWRATPLAVVVVCWHVASTISHYLTKVSKLSLSSFQFCAKLIPVNVYLFNWLSDSLARWLAVPNWAPTNNTRHTHTSTTLSLSSMSSWPSSSCVAVLSVVS